MKNQKQGSHELQDRLLGRTALPRDGVRGRGGSGLGPGEASHGQSPDPT